VHVAASLEWTFHAELWLWRADAAWHFITLPHEVADEIEDVVVDRRGFGSIRVQVRIGGSTWQTSIFPSKEAQSFLLPIKKAVRVAEGLEVGDSCQVLLRLAEV
jgi:hypothetical protein